MRFILVFTAAVLTLCFTACNGAQQTSQPGQPPAPTAVFNNYVEAARKNDLPKMRSVLSKGTLALIEKLSVEQKIAPEDILSDIGQEVLLVNQNQQPQTRNEQIAGDTAIIELLNPIVNEWEPVPFVREDGQWKLALDKQAEEIERREAEAEKAATPAAPNTNALPNNQANKPPVTNQSNK